MSFLRRFSRSSDGKDSGNNPSSSSSSSGSGSGSGSGSNNNAGPSNLNVRQGIPTKFDSPGRDDDLSTTSYTPRSGDSIASGSIFTQSTTRTGRSGRTASTAATSIGSSVATSGPMGGSGKRSSHDDRLRVLDASTLFESQSSTPVAAGSSSRQRSSGWLGTVPEAPFVEPVPMPLSMVGASPPTHDSRPSRLPEPTRVMILDSIDALAARMVSLSSDTSIHNALSIAPQVGQLIADFLSSPVGQSPALKRVGLTLEDSIPLTSVVLVVMRFVDVLLGAARGPMRLHLLRLLGKLAQAFGWLDSQPPSGGGFGSSLAYKPVQELRNFALGSSPVLNERLVIQLVNSISTTTLVESEGAYVAPVLRGIHPRCAVATLCIGLPGGFEAPEREALDSLQQSPQCRDIHIYARKDLIRTAQAEPSAATWAGPRAPFRIPRDPDAPPMAVSLANEHAHYISGTLGGYIYPIVDARSPFGRSTFAVTCGHVCLNPSQPKAKSAEDTVQITRESVTIPSPVLLRIFSKALLEERSKHPPSSDEFRAYNNALKQIENQPPRKLGEVVWGERSVVDGSISDVAIIQCLASTKCRNTLGDDVDMSQYDPALLLGNLDVTSIASNKTRGLEVFKYGSTSKYTHGVASDARIVYWSSGRLQTSEFAVRGQDSSMFATGGDSGAWIFTKNPGRQRGLAVLGMLHSYDGEYKEFGLYTHIDSVLKRLHQVTGINWGVVGVPSAEDLHESE